MMTSAARKLFDDVLARGYEGLKKLKEENAVETQNIDFKGISNNNVARAPMADIDKKTLAEVLSGFANSDGGVIIWGPDARRDKDNLIDGLKHLSPIKNLAVFMSQLDEMTPQLIEPYVNGIEHKPIKSDQDNDEGFAITYVPRWEGLPVMGKAKGKFTFFCRSGSTFTAMSHSALSDRFGRRPQPQLKIIAKAYPRESQPYNHVSIELFNEGLGLAQKLWITITPGDFRGMSEIYPNESHFGTRSNSSEQLIYESFMDTCIHPGRHLPLFSFQNHLAQPFSATFAVFCAEMRPRKFWMEVLNLEITSEQIEWDGQY